MKALKFNYYWVWFCIVAVYALFIFGVFGEPSHDIAIFTPTVVYVLSSILVLVTLGAIYLCLKLVFIERIRKNIRLQGFFSYAHWCQVRVWVLGTVILLDLLYYILTLESLGGLCALIGCLALLFINPSEGEYERLIHDDNEVPEQ